MCSVRPGRARLNFASLPCHVKIHLHSLSRKKVSVSGKKLPQVEAFEPAAVGCGVWLFHGAVAKLRANSEDLVCKVNDSPRISRLARADNVLTCRIIVLLHRCFACDICHVSAWQDARHRDFRLQFNNEAVGLEAAKLPYLKPYALVASKDGHLVRAGALAARTL